MNKTRRSFRLSLGLVTWSVAVAMLVGFGRRQSGAAPHAADASVMRYLLSPPRASTALDTTGHVTRHVPVFVETGTLGSEADESRVDTGPDAGVGQRWRQVGYVRSVAPRPADSLLDVSRAGDPSRRSGEAGSSRGDRHVTIRWHDERIDPNHVELVLYRQDGRLEDVLRVMFPAQKRDRIRVLLTEAMARHGERLTETLRPLVEQTFRDSLPIIEAEFRESVARHRDEIDRLGSRLRQELVADRLVPLVKQEVLPIVREHAQPPMEEIGRELWDRASLWRFGWRAMYDKTPLPRRDLVRDEWDRFIDEEAIPVLESHVDDFVVAVERIVADVAANRAVRGELADELDRLADDPEATQLARSILRETFVENRRLRERWREIWTSEPAREALERVGETLEPTIRQIGDELFGTREGGIDPDFARVLRSQILRKDRVWLVARPRSHQPDRDPRESSPPLIRRAEDAMSYPVVFLTDEGREPAP